MRTTPCLGSLLLLTACGGNVTVDATGGATTTSTISTTFPTSTTLTGAGGTTTTTTSTTSSTVSTSSGSLPDCAAIGVNGVGLMCDQEGTMCRMDYACCGGAVICSAGVWTAEPPTCNQPCLPCGDGLVCSVGAICVHDTSVYDSYQCVKNPCGGMPDCTCAESACAMNFQQCKSTQMYTVTCGGT